MRVLIACLVVAGLGLAAATPAAAQNTLALTLSRDADHFAAEQAARQRDITLTNDIARLEAQVQTNQALAGLAAQQALARSTAPPPVPRDPNAPPPVIDLSKLTSIPDAALAQSNARVLAAAANRK